MDINLKQSIQEFIFIFNKYKQDGSFSETNNFHWDSHLASSAEIEFFYKKYAPDTSTFLEIGSSILNFLSLDRLFELHKGYKWIQNKKTNHYEKIGSWSDGWLLFGLFNDEPIIASTLESNTPILASYETGDAKLISNSLSSYFKALTIAIEVQHGIYENNIIDEETFEIKNGFLTDVFTRISRVFGEITANSFIDFFYG